MANSTHGIDWDGGFQTNWVIKNCQIIGNGTDGVHIQGFTANIDHVVIMNNVISNNGRFGIFFDGDSINNIILFNSLVQNATANIREDSGSGTGPNTILGNFAYHSDGDSSNYSILGASMSGVNKVVTNQSGGFPTTIPSYWHNISMTP